MSSDRKFSKLGLQALRLAVLVLAAGLAGSAGASRDDLHSDFNDVPTERANPRGGIGIGIDLTCIFTGCGKDKRASDDPGDAAQLANSGPTLPDAFSMSSFAMHGLVQGGAPFVVDYEATGARLRIEMKIPGAEPFVYTLNAKGRGEQFFRLPEAFGVEPQAALI